MRRVQCFQGALDAAIDRLVREVDFYVYSPKTRIEADVGSDHEEPSFELHHRALEDGAGLIVYALVKHIVDFRAQHRERV
jgi:hypothetical protein